MKATEKQDVRLVTPDTTTPVSPSILVLVTEVGLGGLDESGKSLVVLRTNVLEGNNGGGLLVNDCSETGLVLDDNVRDTHLAQDSRKRETTNEN